MSIFFGMKLDKNHRNILSRRKVNFFEMKLDKNRRNILSRRKGHFFWENEIAEIY